MTGGRAHALAVAITLGVAGCPSTEPVQSGEETPARGSGDENVMFPEERAAQRRAEDAPPASDTVERGERLLAKGQAAEAQQLFEQAIETHPGDVRAHLDLGLAFEMQGDPQAAEKAYRRALDVDSRFPEALNNLGLLLREQGRYKEAIALFEKATEVRDEFADAYLNLALALEDAGRLKAAADAYRELKELQPDNAVARANLGLVLLELGNRDQAAIELRRALSKAGRNAAALQAIGNGLRRSGQFEQAVRAMRQAVESHEGGPTPALLSELALAQHAAGSRQSAEQSLRRALELDGDYTTAHFLLGSMLAGRKAYEEAVDHFERYLEGAPRGPHADKVRERLRAARRAAE